MSHGLESLDYAVALFATIGLVISTNLSYAVGPGGDWMRSNKTFVMVLDAFLLAALMIVAAIGVGVSRGGSTEDCFRVGKSIDDALGVQSISRAVD